MNSLLKTYQKLLLNFPFGIQVIQTGLLMGTGDLIAQLYVENKSFEKIHLKRTAQFTLIGTFFVGPSLTIWYGVLQKYFGSKGKVTAFKKVAVDQLLFAPGFLAVVMSVVGVAQGNSLSDIKDRMIHDYPEVLINNYKLWPAVQLCNFYVVPLQYQVVTVQFVAIIWNTYLSWKMNERVPTSPHQHGDAQVKERDELAMSHMLMRTGPVGVVICIVSLNKASMLESQSDLSLPKVKNLRVMQLEKLPGGTSNSTVRR